MLGVLVTRPFNQALKLAEQLKAAEINPILFPCLEIKALSLTQDDENLVVRWQEFDWVIFISPNAVEHFFQLAISNDKKQHAKIAAVGSSTAKSLIEKGFTVDLVPSSGFSTEALLAEAPLHEIDGKNILLVKGKGGRQELGDTLTNRGACVESLSVYERICPNHDPEPIIQLFKSGKIDFILITSAEALHNLTHLVGGVCKKTPIVVSSPRLVEIAKIAGFETIHLAADASDTALVQFLKGDK